LTKMRRVVASLMGVVVFFAVAVVAGAQEKKAAKGDQDRVSGTILRMNKDTKTITVRTSANIERQVVFSADTKFTKQNEPGGSSDDLKDGTRLICLGKFNDKTQLIADRIDIRLPR
jgi:hypothetical protein